MSTPEKTVGKILYSIQKASAFEPELDGNEDELLLYVTPKDYFDKEKCQSDWTPQETFDFLNQLGFRNGECMEGVVEIEERTPSTRSRLEEHLEANPLFITDPRFDKLLEECYDDIEE